MNIDTKARQLLQGAVAYHTHVGWMKDGASHFREPLKPIIADPLKAVKDAAAWGLQAIVLRDLVSNSAGMASILQQVVPEIEVVGSIFLNAQVGGMNPEAVDAAMTYGSGAKIVTLATDSSAHMARMMFGLTPEEIAADPVKYVTPFLPDGKLRPETYRIFEFIAEADVVLEIGGYSTEDGLKLIREAKRVGVNKIVGDHGMKMKPEGERTVPLEELLLEAVDLGAVIEVSWTQFTHIGRYYHRRFAKIYPFRTKPEPSDIADVFDLINKLGAKNCLVGTDLGILILPPPEEGLRQFVASMLTLGLSEQDVTTMIRDNPLRLLGLRDRTKQAPAASQSAAVS